MIGNRISKRRKERNFTQNSLAESLFVTHQAVSKWENGKSLPSIDILCALTKLLDVSIDYLLDDTDINQNDYETQFQNYPRDIVLSEFLKKENSLDHIIDIFYLLNSKERVLVLNQIISKNNCSTVQIIWPYLNKVERTYLLGVILSGKCDFNVSILRHQLTDEERQIIYKKK